MRRHIADGDNNYDDSSNDREGTGFRKRGEDPRVMHVFKGQKGLSKNHISIVDVYDDIKAHATAIVYVVRALVPKIDLFIDVMEDWDVDADGGSDSDKED